MTKISQRAAATAPVDPLACMCRPGVCALAEGIDQGQKCRLFTEPPADQVEAKVEPAADIVAEVHHPGCAIREHLGDECTCGAEAPTDSTQQPGARLGLGIDGDTETQEAQRLIEELRRKGRFAGFSIAEREAVAALFTAGKRWWFSNEGSRREKEALNEIVDVVEVLCALAVR